MNLKEYQQKELENTCNSTQKEQRIVTVPTKENTCNSTNKRVRECL